MKYLLLFCATKEELAAWQALSEEARAQTRAKSGQWMTEYRAQIRSDNGLHLPHTVTSVHIGASGHPLVTDGPFLSLIAYQWNKTKAYRACRRLRRRQPDSCLVANLA